MGTSGEPARRQSADLDACYHEAAHVIVARAFDFSVADVWVRGEEGSVYVPRATEPTDECQRARDYWQRLCFTVAGPLGEFLYEELVDADGIWPTNEERAQKLSFYGALFQGLAGGRGNDPAAGGPKYPSGELGEMLRYVALVTGKVLTVTGLLWCSIAGNANADAGDGSGFPTDSSKALEYAGRFMCAKPAAKPFEQEWPADGVDADGLFAEIHIIRYAELEAERILKREWECVSAVALSLFRRKNHRMSGRQLGALLRKRGGPR